MSMRTVAGYMVNGVIVECEQDAKTSRNLYERRLMEYLRRIQKEEERI